MTVFVLYLRTQYCSIVVPEVIDTSAVREWKLLFFGRRSLIIADYLEKLKRIPAGDEGLTMTVLTGINAGERVLLSSGQILHSGGEEALKWAGKLESVMKSGTYEIAGERVFIEKSGVKDHLVVLGCGHVAIPVIKIAKMADFLVTAVDDREEYAEAARKAGADKALSGSFTEVIESLKSDDHTYFIIVTREHLCDVECLRAVLKKSCAYIGMMGARRRVQAVKEMLISEGFVDRDFEKLHTPIGLKINSDTPAEIAVSILAELIQERHKDNNILWPDDILGELTGDNAYAGHSTLCTVVSKEGSAPREVGARMLVRDDGKVINTIGGGPTEMFVIDKCRKGLAGEEELPQLIKRDLGSKESAKEGEFCGGVVEIFVERAG